MIEVLQVYNLPSIEELEGEVMVLNGEKRAIKDTILQTEDAVMDDGVEFAFDRSGFKDGQMNLGNYAIKLMGSYITMTGRSLLLGENGKINLATQSESSVWETLLTSELADVVYFMCGGDAGVFRVHVSAIDALRKLGMLSEDGNLLTMPDGSEWELEASIPTFLAFQLRRL